MSYINPSLLNDVLVREGSNEQRYQKLGLIDAAKASTLAVDYITPSSKALFSNASSLQQTKFPTLVDGAVEVRTQASFDIPANLPLSANIGYVAYDIFSGFRHYASTFASNQLDSDYVRAEVLKKVLYKMAKTKESIIAAILEDRKTQVLGFTTQVSQGNGTFTFDGASDTLKISKAAQKETMFYNLSSLLDSNDLLGGKRLVTSLGGLTVQRTEAIKNGMNNASNLQGLGFFPEDRLHESASISAGADVFNGWLIRDGEIGLYSNFPYEFAKGTVIGGKEFAISDTEVPFLNSRVNVYTNREATDSTALITAGTDSNSIMASFEEMAIWDRFYIVYRYNSDLANRANGIVKISGLTS